jgi:hypothetical protein
VSAVSRLPHLVGVGKEELLGVGGVAEDAVEAAAGEAGDALLLTPPESDDEDLLLGRHAARLLGEAAVDQHIDRPDEVPGGELPEVPDVQHQRAPGRAGARTPRRSGPRTACSAS